MSKKNKNKLSLFLSVLLLFQLVIFNGNNTFAATTPTISYSINGDATVGNTIDIVVNVSNISDLYGGSIDFLYDSSLLEVQSITKGNVLGSDNILTPLGSNGKISDGQASFAITLKGNTPGVSVSNGTLAVIKAKVLKAGTVKLNTTTSNSALSLTGNTIRVKLSNAMANSINYSPINTSITLNNVLSSATLNSFTADKSSGQPLGTTVNFTANSNAGSDALYKFYALYNGKWTVLQDYSSKNTLAWKPTNAGTYTIRVWAKHKDSTTTALGDSYKDISFTINKLTTATLSSFTADKTSGQPLGTTINFTANSNAGSDALYKFYALYNGKWTVLQDYSSKNTLAWKPTNAGTYTIRVWAKHKDSTTTALGDSYKDISFTINKLTTATLSSFTADKTSGQPLGTTINFTANSNAGSDALYKFYALYNGKWTVLQDYSSKNTLAWKPTNAGTYTIRVWAKHKDSTTTALGDSYKDISFTINKLTTATLSSFTADKTSGQPLGTTVNFTANSNAGSDALYKFYALYNGKWTVLQDYSSKNTLAWKPTAAGTYTIRVWAKHKDSTTTALGDSYKDISFTINKLTTATLSSFTADKTSGQPLGTTVNFTANSNAGSDALYKFYALYNGKWTVLQDYSSKNTLAWKPTAAGTYTIRVWAKHKDSTTTALGDSYKDISFTINKVTTATLSSFTADKTSGQPLGTTINFTANSNAGSDALYKFYALYNGKWTVLQDYSSKNTLAWKPTNAGTYTIRVWAKHKDSTTTALGDSYKDISFTIK